MRPDARSIPELLGDTLSQTATLLRNEAELARVEVSEKLGQAARGAVLIGIGVAFVAPALTLLLAALAAALIAQGMTPAVACLIAAGVAFVVAGLAIGVGMSRFSAERLKPRATLEQMRRDRTAAKELLQ
jgi:uncharacterized membrane protein YqjE